MFPIKEASSKVVLVYLVTSIVLVSIINLVLFPVFDPIARATGSLIVFGWGKLRPSDVGLHWEKLAQRLSLTALLWLGTQSLTLLINWINGDIHLDPVWRGRGVTTALGGLALFILSHIPLDFTLLFVWGLFFAAVYLVSGNLFLAIGVHALLNWPTLITEATLPPQVILLCLTLILLAILRGRQQPEKRNVVPMSCR